MSFVETQDAKERVRDAANIVDVVGSYLTLQRQGSIFVTHCPWHQDQRPSLQVNPNRESWKCWVCDIGGDVFSFVMKYENVDFRQALEMLAERTGVELPRNQPQPRTKHGDPNDKQTLYDAMAWAEQQFRECLRNASDAEVARRYFSERGINDDSLTGFHLGFSPDNWTWLLDRSRSTQYSPEVLEAAGILGKSPNSGRHYDRFKGRVIFPIRDVQNRPIAFGGRILPEFAKEDSAKYVNSPETRLFSKSEHVYGLDQAREVLNKRDDELFHRHVVVVEGYTDVIMAHQFGLKNFVAVLGTALGARHIPLLRRFADKITLVLDGDEAGQRRTNEVLELFVASEVDLRILTLPAGADPCDYVLEHGPDAMRTLLGSAVDAFEHAVRSLTSGIDLINDTHSANQALDKLLTVVSKAPRLSAATSSSRLVRERQLLARLARDFRVDESVLRTRLSELRARTTPSRPKATETDKPRVTLKDVDAFDAELLEILTQHPELVDVALTEIESAQLNSTPARVIYEKYRVVSDRGEPVEFARILSELEDPDLKSLLVSFDESASEKELHAHEDAPARLRRLIERIQLKREDAQRQQSLAVLEDGNLTPEEEDELLLKLVEQQRKRQGF